MVELDSEFKNGLFMVISLLGCNWFWMV